MQENKKLRFSISRSRVAKIILFIYDAFVVNFSYLFALWLRFDCEINMLLETAPEYVDAWLKFIPLNTVFCLVVFSVFKLYRSIWTFASYREFFNVAYSSVVTFVFHTVAITLIFNRMPVTYYFFGALIQFILVLFVRFSYRFILLERSRRTVARSKKSSRVMLVGAGAAGRMILHDMNMATDSADKVVCLIDDNPNKIGRYIDNLCIVGDRYDIPKMVNKYGVDKIYITIPTIQPADKKEILEICKETDCELKILPDIFKLEEGTINKGTLVDVAIEDLLGRDPITIDMGEIFTFLQDKTILVTGGGGSIGSELCRQIADHNPKRLIIFDIYENNAYDIQQELRENYPQLDLVVLIGSVRDSRKIFDVFAKYKPEVVYHAAAHKHVPLMEHSPCEAIKNNVLGTYKTAFAASLNGCKRFVLISTDKAVNPTNIMGASKRICEMIIQSFAKKIAEGEAYKLLPLRLHTETENTEDDVICVRNVENPKTEFVAVRFGNVLGSNGSVIPRFKEQIAKGGPVTVTHPEIIRYFMTIPEASSLVLQAGTYAEGGEIFVLDMGAPVKIDTLARNLIKLSGLKPDVDIKISYTGLRPGEKLYEEKLMSEEGLKTTPNELIHIGAPIPFDENDFLNKLHILMEAAYSDNEDDIRNIVSKIVPTYRSADVHGSIPNNKVFSSQMKEIEQKDIVEKELLTKNG